MIEEKDRYDAPATCKAARLSDIPAGNSGQEADPTDKFTEPLQPPPYLPAGRPAATDG
jgi:hypothetical protein